MPTTPRVQWLLLLSLLCMSHRNNFCQAFVTQRPTLHACRQSLHTKYLYVDHDREDVPSYTPEVMPRVPRRHERIKEWNPPSPPSYMPREEVVSQQQQQRTSTTTTASSPSSSSSSHESFDKYVTVSAQQWVRDPNELKPKLAPTAPVQPATPSAEEFTYATLKEFVTNPWCDMAAPEDFALYMTVTDEQEQPHGASSMGVRSSSTVVDAIIVDNEPEEKLERESYVDKSTPTNDYSSTTLNKEHYHTANESSSTSADSNDARNINKNFAKRWREKYFPKSPDEPTMKQLAEYYWNQEKLHQQQQQYQQRRRQQEFEQQQQSIPFTPDWMHAGRYANHFNAGYCQQ